MSKDLIIGGMSNYDYDKVKYWINSAKRSGFEGDIVLLATNIYATDIKKITAAGAIVVPYGREDAGGNYVTHQQMPPHVERFFHIWNFLNTCGTEYDFVIATDVRDVVFQRNPSDFLAFDDMCDFVAAGEGLAYEDEPWGNNNYLQAFGPFFHNLIKRIEIYNVGVMAGQLDIVRDIMLMILQLSINRPINIVDQAVYNFILNTDLVKSRAEFFGNDSGWTCNLGTTLAAIQSGAGDIGQRNDPTAQIVYQTKYMYKQPIIQEDGTVCNSHGIPFCIVHQYDRIAGLTEKMRVKYDDEA
jgi:hypothetical protein